jgi:hypothetical protein
MPPLAPGKSKDKGDSRAKGKADGPSPPAATPSAGAAAAAGAAGAQTATKQEPKRDAEGYIISENRGFDTYDEPKPAKAPGATADAAPTATGGDSDFSDDEDEQKGPAIVVKINEKGREIASAEALRANIGAIQFPAKKGKKGKKGAKTKGADSGSEGPTPSEKRKKKKLGQAGTLGAAISPAGAEAGSPHDTVAGAASEAKPAETPAASGSAALSAESANPSASSHPPGAPGGSSNMSDLLNSVASTPPPQVGDDASWLAMLGPPTSTPSTTDRRESLTDMLNSLGPPQPASAASK